MPNVICPEDQLMLSNTSTGLIDTWRWNYTIGTSNVQLPQPINFPANNIESLYTIKLVATNNAIGCSDSMSKVLKVLDNCFIAVPSAFTPNGDGLNDFLYPNNALKAANLEFKVFNRWGQVVFESRNWQEKWNGKIKGASHSKPGYYVWFLRYTHSRHRKKSFPKGNYDADQVSCPHSRPRLRRRRPSNAQPLLFEMMHRIGIFESATERK